MRALVLLFALGLIAYGCAGTSEPATENHAAGGKGGTGARGGAAGKGAGGAGGSSGSGDAAGNQNAGGLAGGGEGARGNGGAGERGLAGDDAGGFAGDVAVRGCASPSAWSSNLVGCEGGYVHRPTASACELSPHEGAGGDGSGGAAGQSSIQNECETDADCSEGPNGYCVAGLDVEGGAHCVYACRTDADCGTNELCACDDTKSSARSQSPLSLGVCTPATCRTDAECGSGTLCVASLESVCSQVPKTTPDSFHCQSPHDECNGATDCETTGTEGEAYRYSCFYNETHFVCTSSTGC